MLGRGIRWPLFTVAMICMTGMGLLPQSAQAQAQFDETIAVLNIVYSGEVQAHRRYMAFAEKAMQEDQPNIAHLFRALAASEGVHARNFKTLLKELGTDIKTPVQTEIQVKTTRLNLKQATQVEISEIDDKYPKLLQRLKSEGHEEAIEKLTYAWEAEKQHRELIKEILSGTGIFYGVLTRKFRESDVRYFVCQNCGSTVVALPGETCPVCDVPASEYREIKKTG